MFSVFCYDFFVVLLFRAENLTHDCAGVCLIKNFGAALWDAFVAVFVSRWKRMAVLWWLLLVAKIAHLSVTWHNFSITR